MVLVLLAGCDPGGDVDAYLRSAQIAIAAGEYDAASLALDDVPGSPRRYERPSAVGARGTRSRPTRPCRAPGKTATRIAPDDGAVAACAIAGTVAVSRTRR